MYLLSPGTINVTVLVPLTQAGATSSTSYVDVSLDDSSGTTQRGYYAGTSGNYAVYGIPEFDKVQNGSYTISASFSWWTTSIIGLPITSTISTSTDVNVPDKGSEDVSVTITF